MPDKILEVSQVRSGYGSGDILQGVSLSIDEAEIVAVIGRNGVGKTTLMKSVIGLLSPSAGQIRFLGTDVTARAARERSARGIGYVPQGRQVFPELTVKENLLTGEQVNSRSRVRRLRYDLVYEYFPILKDRRSQLGGTLSGGQQQMLSIGRALVGSPKLLLLDEPSAGVQPSTIQAIGSALVQLNKTERLTILFVEQNIALISNLAHRGYAMSKGLVVAELDGQEIKDRDRMIKYLAL